jgi:hypothetical protein
MKTIQRRHTILPALLLLLSSCATLNQQECRSKTPAALGLADGRQGYGLWRLDAHIKSCARFQLPFDRSPYLQAREQGLMQYCTPENGMRTGQRGESYEGVCPPALEGAFLQTYLPAIYLYRQEYPTRFGLPIRFRHP